MDQSALLRAILDEPDDDVHRLVYADWLDEHGEPDRAEFIRTQIELAKLDEDDPRRPALEDREAKLLADHHESWLAELPEEAREVESYELGETFRRGFVVRAELTAEAFLRCGPRLFEAAPIETLRLQATLIGPRSAEVFASALLARVRELDVGCEHLTADDARRLADCPHLHGLRSINLGSNPIGDLGLAALCASPNLSDLRELRLWWTGIGPRGVSDLLTSPLLPRLRSLHLGGGESMRDGRAALTLLASGGLDSLEELGLRSCGLSGNRATMLASTGSYSGVDVLSLNESLFDLKWLDLHYNPIGEAGLVALSRSRWMGNLRHLDLGDASLTAAGLAALAASPHLTELRSLRLDNSSVNSGPDERVGPDGIRGLADGSMTNLRVLTLDCNDLGDEGMAVLAAWSGLATVRELHLDENGITDRGLIALAESPFVGGLERLHLDNNEIGDAGLAALAASPMRENLVELWLSRGRASVAGLRALAQTGPFPRLRDLSVGDLIRDDDGTIEFAGSPNFPMLPEH